MRDTLASIFGENSASLAQILISLIVFIALIGVVIWLVRRYATGGTTSTPRGRLPRLAVVDALTIDNRRRLLLVRRDNVEHLVLVGGPTDIVVEPSIVRTRVAQRPGQAPPARSPAQPATNAPQPAPPPPPERNPPQKAPRASAVRTSRAQPAGGDNSIPFPPRRAQVRQVARDSDRELPTSIGAAADAASRPEPEENPPARTIATLDSTPMEEETAREMQRVEAAVVEMTEATAPRTEPQLARAAPPMARVAPRAVPGESPFAPSTEAPPAAASPFAPVPGGRPDAGPHPVRAIAEEPTRPPPRAADDGDDGGLSSVSDLEKDMARLLGQISTGRSA